jgi:hypothetical protein
MGTIVKEVGNIGRRGANFKGKGTLHLDTRAHKKGSLQGTADTCIMADWAAN